MSNEHNERKGGTGHMDGGRRTMKKMKIKEMTMIKNDITVKKIIKKKNDNN